MAPAAKFMSTAEHCSYTSHTIHLYNGMQLHCVWQDSVGVLHTDHKRCYCKRIETWEGIPSEGCMFWQGIHFFGNGIKKKNNLIFVDVQ